MRIEDSDEVSSGFTASIESAREARAAEAELQLITMLGDYAALQAFIARRTTAPVFVKAVSKRVKLTARRDEVGRKYDALARRITYAKARNIVSDDALEQQMLLKKLAISQRNIREELNLHAGKLSNYRRITAQAAAAASALREKLEREAGTFIEYTAPTIGDLEVTGSFPANSPEWHAARLSGIGGSDVGAIMRGEGEYDQANYSQVFAVKTGREEPAEITARISLDAIERGNLWENAVLQRFADENPSLRVAFCKDSWAGREKPYRRANFDGLILDAFGTAEGIIEIKTSSNPTDWGSPELGLWGVPRGYRKQVLWYAVNANLKYGYVVALINDTDYREYRFDMSDPAIVAECKEIIERTDAFWALVETGRDTERVVRKNARGFGAKPDYVKVAEVLAAYAGWALSSAHRAVRRAILDEEEFLRRPLNETEQQAVLFSLFAEHNPEKRRRPLIGIDLETTGQSPRSGRIIEMGIAQLNAAGDSKVLMDQLFSLPPGVQETSGLGMVSVHGITPEMLEGKPLFEDPAHQKAILKHLKRGVVVAHNAGFEDRWLAANLEGYIEAREAGEITLLDTRTLSRYLMPKSTDSSLRTFSEDNGVPYEGAHRAVVDVLMMLKALRTFQLSIHRNGRFIRRNVTEKSRRLAVDELATVHE